jgi:hypothetical protein
MSEFFVGNVLQVLIHEPKQIALVYSVQAAGDLKKGVEHKNKCVDLRKQVRFESDNLFLRF